MLYHQIRRLSQQQEFDDRKTEKLIQQLEVKADKLRRSLAEEDDTSLQEHYEDLESVAPDKPSQHNR